MTNLERYAKSTTTDGMAAKKYREYRNFDIRNGFDGNATLTADEIKRLCYSEDSECVYCGSRVELGVDRIDNSLGHTRDNSVCACRRCNTARGDNYTHEDFKEISKQFKISNKTFMGSLLYQVKDIDDLLSLKKFSKNRDVRDNHVQEIANEVIKNGYFDEPDIKVEKNTMEIIAGQHRVAAAIDIYNRTGKLIPMEILFVDYGGDQERMARIIRSNESNRANWDIKDFVTSYRGDKEYNQLMDFMERHDIKGYKILMHILNGINKGDLAKRMCLDDIEVGEKVVLFLKDAYGENVFKENEPDGLCHARNVCSAIKYIFNGGTTTSTTRDKVNGKVLLINSFMASKGHDFMAYAPYYRKHIDRKVEEFMKDHAMKIPNSVELVGIIADKLPAMEEDYQRDLAKREKQKRSVRKPSIVAE